MTDTEQPFFEIRKSSKHGSGAFALRTIPKRTRLIEYTGERITHKEADSRPDIDDGTGSIHVLLFTVDSRTVIDARVGGNEAQYFNHSCDGNCEAVIENRRVYLETVCEVEAGEELTYDYEMEYGGEDLEEARTRYPCRCGSPRCRGTLLDIPAKLLKKSKTRSKARPAGRSVTRKAEKAPKSVKRVAKSHPATARTKRKPARAR